MNWKSIGVTAAIVLVVLVVLSLVRRSRIGDPIERVTAMFSPGLPDAPSGAES